jgi:hypothetical protein
MVHPAVLNEVQRTISVLSFALEDKLTPIQKESLSIAHKLLGKRFETRVYTIDVHTDLLDGKDDVTRLSNEEFMLNAEAQGTVYTLESFQNAFNEEVINSSRDYIRFIQVQCHEMQS